MSLFSIIGLAVLVVSVLGCIILKIVLKKIITDLDGCDGVVLKDVEMPDNDGWINI